MHLICWLDSTLTDDFKFMLWILFSFTYNLTSYERENWHRIFWNGHRIIWKICYDDERTVCDLTTTFHEKRNSIMINKNSAHSYHELFTHGMHVRVVCQSLPQNTRIRTSYDFLKCFPAFTWRSWRLCMLENEKISNGRFNFIFCLVSKQ